MMQTLAELALAYPTTLQAGGIAVVVGLAVLQMRRYGQRHEERTGSAN